MLKNNAESGIQTPICITFSQIGLAYDYLLQHNNRHIARQADSVLVSLNVVLALS